MDVTVGCEVSELGDLWTEVDAAELELYVVSVEWSDL